MLPSLDGPIYNLARGFRPLGPSGIPWSRRRLPVAIGDRDQGAGGNITFSSYGNVVPVAAVSATYQTTLADFLILASGSFTVTLLTSGVPVGQTYVVKNTGSGTITVVGQTGNIDGAASISLATQYQAATLTFDGANWWVS